MTVPGSDDLVAARVRVMQIVIGALLIGVAVFAGIALFLRQQRNNPPPATPTVSYMALGFAVATFAARLVVLPSIERGARKTPALQAGTDLNRWLNLYQTRMIVGAALLEGPAFFALAAYLIEGTPWAFGLAVLLWLAMAWLHFPTRDRVAAWIAEQQDAAAQSRTGA
jgi:uncharacterized membrane protein YbhN (UPF0104 family)